MNKLKKQNKNKSMSIVSRFVFKIGVPSWLIHCIVQLIQYERKTPACSIYTVSKSSLFTMSDEYNEYSHVQHTRSTFCVCIQSTLLTPMKATDQQVWTFPNFQILKAPLKFLYSLWATETVKHLWPRSAGNRNFQDQSLFSFVFRLMLE